jgi:hypothetical protein
MDHTRYIDGSHKVYRCVAKKMRFLNLLKKQPDLTDDAKMYIAKYKITYKRLIGKGKGKVVPLQVWSSPEGSRKLRFQIT